MGQVKRRIEARVRAGGPRYPWCSRYRPGSHENLIRFGLHNTLLDLSLEAFEASAEVEWIGDGDLRKFQPKLTQLIGMAIVFSLAAKGAGLDPEPPDEIEEGLSGLGLYAVLCKIDRDADTAADEVERIGDGDLKDFQPTLTRLMETVAMLPLIAMKAGLDPEPPDEIEFHLDDDFA